MAKQAIALSKHELKCLLQLAYPKVSAPQSHPLLLKHPVPNNCNEISPPLQNTLPPRLLLRYPAPPTAYIDPHIDLSIESDNDSQSVSSTDSSDCNSSSESGNNSSSESNESSLYASVSKSKYKRLENKSKIADKLMHQFKNHTRTAFDSPLARSFIATGLANCPTLSSSSASCLFSCIVNALLIEVGVNVDPSKVAGNCPSRSTLNNISSENAANILVLIRQRIKEKRSL